MQVLQEVSTNYAVLGRAESGQSRSLSQQLMIDQSAERKLACNDIIMRLLLTLLNPEPSMSDVRVVGES